MPHDAGHSAANRVGRQRWPARLRPLLLGVFLMLALPLCHASGPQVIVNHAVAPVELDRHALRSLFTLRTREWGNGMPVRVFVLDDSDPRHAAFCTEVLGTFPYILRRTWDRNLFSGTGLAPERVRDEREMLEKVRSTPGGVGYLTGSDTPSSHKQSGGTSYVRSIPAK